MVQLSVKVGIVKDVLREQGGDIEKHTFNHRVRKLRLITYPTYIKYEDFSKAREEFLSLDKDASLASIRTKFMTAIKYLVFLEKASPEERSVDSISNDRIEILKKSIITT